MEKDRTCEDRISEQLESRTRHLRALDDLATVSDEAELAIVMEDDATREAYEDIIGNEQNVDNIREAADEARWELPLSVSKSVVYRIDLSTGGPADWFEVHYDPENREIGRIEYHFSDWFDHASRVLDGSEYDAASTFAQSIIPDLQ